MAEEKTITIKLDAPERLHPGDKVRLNSGGPEMTVVQLTQAALCQWHDAEGKLQFDYFAAPTVTLKREALTDADAHG